MRAKRYAKKRKNCAQSPMLSALRKAKREMHANAKARI